MTEDEMAGWHHRLDGHEFGWYDLNQILYDYTMEVPNQIKGLDLIDRVPKELRIEVCDIVQEAGNKNIPKKQKCKKAKWLSEEA